MKETNVDTTNEETFKKLFELLSGTKASGTAQGEDYKLTFKDVEQLHDTYCNLETNIKKSDKQTGAAYINEIEGYLICALKYEARNISDKRALEYAVYKAKLEAKNDEETPDTWRNPWKFFKKEKNRAQELVDDEAALNADYLHNVKEANLKQLEQELEQIEVGSVAGEDLSLSKRIKLRRKITKHKRALRRLEKKWRAAESAPASEEVAGVQSEAPTTTETAASTTKAEKKPKKKVTPPVVVIEEIPGQLPGQMRIENADTTT